MEKLNSTAIEQLIARYQQELEKLRFQTMKTKDTIAELKEGLQMAKEREASVLQEMREKHQYSSAAEEKATSKTTKKSGRSKKAKSAESGNGTETTTQKASAKKTTTSKSRGAKKTKKAKKSRNDRSKGYRLSPVDELVMQALATREMALKTAELHEFAAGELQKQGEPMDDERLRLLISRSLQKLANRRDDVVKLRNPDERGHLYALPDWVTGKGEDVKLKRKFQRK